MNDCQIKKSAEGTASSILNVFYYINVFICVVVILCGVGVLMQELFLGLCIVVLAIVYLLAIVLCKALCDIFINISIKLEKGDAILSELQVLETILKQNVNDTRSLITFKNQSQEETKVEGVVSKPQGSTCNKVKVEEVVLQVNDYVENDIVEKVSEGSEFEAKLLLMKERGLSLDEATAYIDKLRVE